MATIVATNGWFQSMGSGNDQPHVIIAQSGYLFVGCESNPGRLVRLSQSSPSTISTIVFPNDGHHGGIPEAVYIPAKGKIYCLFGDFFGGTQWVTVSEVDPITLVYTDVISAPTYNPEQGSCTFDSTYFYIVSYKTNSIYRYRLSDWVFVSALATSMDRAHNIKYDSETGKIFVTAASDWDPGVPRIARINPATFTVEQYGFWLTAPNIFSDDMGLAPGWVYVGSESTSDVIKYKKTDLSVSVRIPSGFSGARNFGVYYDGGVLWSGVEGSGGFFLKIDPTAGDLVTTYRMPLTITQGNVNEFVRSGTNLYVTGYTAPGWVSQMTVQNFDGVTPPGSIILLFSDRINLLDGFPTGEDQVHPGIDVSDSLRLSDLLGSSRVQANPVADAMEFLDRVDLGNNRGIGITDVLVLQDGFDSLGQIRVSDSLHLIDFFESFEDIPGLVPLTVLVGDSFRLFDPLSLVFSNGEILITDTIHFRDFSAPVQNSNRDDYLRRYLNDVIRF